MVPDKNNIVAVTPTWIPQMNYPLQPLSYIGFEVVYPLDTRSDTISYMIDIDSGLHVCTPAEEANFDQVSGVDDTINETIEEPAEEIMNPHKEIKWTNAFDNLDTNCLEQCVNNRDVLNSDLSDQQSTCSGFHIIFYSQCSTCSLSTIRALQQRCSEGGCSHQHCLVDESNIRTETTSSASSRWNIVPSFMLIGSIAVTLSCYILR